MYDSYMCCVLCVLLCVSVFSLDGDVVECDHCGISVHEGWHSQCVVT